MLTEERHAIILDTVNKNKSVGLNELCQLLYTSESTVRRDLTILDERGLLIKVRGGAIALAENYTVVEHNVEENQSCLSKKRKQLPVLPYLLSMTEILFSLMLGQQRKRC